MKFRRVVIVSVIGFAAIFALDQVSCAQSIELDAIIVGPDMSHEEGNWEAFAHDMGHAGAAVAVASVLAYWQPWVEVNPLLAMFIGTVALPLAQELWDVVHYRGNLFTEEHLWDGITYQPAWTLYAMKESEWWVTLIVGAVTVGAVVYRNFYRKGPGFF